MTAWSAPDADPIANIRAFIEKVRNEPIPPLVQPYVLSPAHYDYACDLLGLPRGTRLTNAQVEEAAGIDFERALASQGRQDGVRD